MHLGRVLPEAGGHHVFGLFDRHAVDVVNGFADLVVAEAVRLTRQREIIVGKAEPLGHDQRLGRYHRYQVRHHGFGGGGIGITLAHHNPAHVLQHILAHLVETGGAHPDHAGLAIGVLFQPYDLGHGAQGVAGIDRLQPAPFGVAQVGHRVQGDIGHRFAKDHVKGDEVIKGRPFQPAVRGKGVRGIERVAGGVERVIERPFAFGHGAGDGVVDHLAKGIVLEKPALVGLGHGH